jgi:hypothetical protein
MRQSLVLEQRRWRAAEGFCLLYWREREGEGEGERVFGGRG